MTFLREVGRDGGSAAKRSWVCGRSKIAKVRGSRGRSKSAKVPSPPYPKDPRVLLESVVPLGGKLTSGGRPTLADLLRPPRAPTLADLLPTGPNFSGFAPTLADLLGPQSKDLPPAPWFPAATQL